MFHLFVSLSYFPRYLLYSTSEIKELFISSTVTTAYSQLLPSASSLVRNQANTSLRLLADSVSNVRLCGGEGSNIVCQVHVLCLFQLTMYKMFQTLCHSVIQKVSSLCDTKRVCDTKVQNIVSLCDTKILKPCCTL